MKWTDDIDSAWFIRVHRRFRPVKISPTWEYRVDRFAATSPKEEMMLRDAQWLNAFGAEGWELVTIIGCRETTALGGSQKGVRRWCLPSTSGGSPKGACRRADRSPDRLAVHWGRRLRSPRLRQNVKVIGTHGLSIGRPSQR